jgi:hypothetical protein
MITKVPENQRRAMEHVDRARSERMTLSGCARAHGVPAREVYDAAAADCRLSFEQTPPFPLLLDANADCTPAYLPSARVIVFAPIGNFGVF